MLPTSHYDKDEADFAVTVTYGGPADEFLKAENTLSMGGGSGNKIEFDTNVRP